MRRAARALLAVAVGASVTAGLGLDRPVEARTVREALALAADPGLPDRRAAAVARATARCMTGRGWATVPVPDPLPAVPDADLDPIAWAARWGLGISTATHMPPAPPQIQPGTRPAGPLPPGDRAAFLAALDGTPGRVGCADRAARDVHGRRDRALARLAPAWATLDAAIAADPVVVTAGVAWSTCVPTLADGRGPAERRTFGERAIAWFSRLSEVAERQSAVDRARIRTLERRFAVRVARCEAAYAAARQAATGAHETRFVARYGPVLQAIGAEIRAVERAYPVEGAVPP